MDCLRNWRMGIGEDIQEAGVVVVVAQTVHVKERLACVQAVGYRLLLHSAERHSRGVVVHRLQQHPCSVNHRPRTAQVVAIMGDAGGS